MPTKPKELRRWLLASAIVVGVCGGCASRQYLSGPMFNRVQQRDPKFAELRVYPSIKFVTLYTRDLGEKFSVAGTSGGVETGHRAQRVESPFARDLPGAVLAAESSQGHTYIWVTFDRKCQERQCAFKFVLSQDQLFRLVQAPTFAGFGPPQVYRRRVSERNLMRQSKIYRKTADVPVYLTTRGVPATIALEIKKKNRVDVETIVISPTGVPPK